MFDKFAEYLIEKKAFFSIFEGYTSPKQAIKDLILSNSTQALNLPPTLQVSRNKTHKELMQELEERKKMLKLDKDKPDAKIMNEPNKEKRPPSTTDFAGDMTGKEGPRNRDANFLSSPPMQGPSDKEKS